MSGSEAVAGGPSESVPEEGQRPRPPCSCQAAMCGAMQGICSCAELKKNTERLRGAVRAQPLMAIVAALGVGVLLGRLAGSRDRATGAER